MNLTSRRDGADTPPPSVLAIATSGLGKRYGQAVAVRDLTLQVPQGEVFGFLGPNGAGKTTAVKMLVGLTHPSNGDGQVLGAPLGNRPARRWLGYLPELFRYQDWLSAFEVCRLHAELAGLDSPGRDAEIRRVLNIVDLTNRARDRAGTFSKGMQQRLGLAVALLGRPRLVLLDEPTSALDPVGRHEVREIIRRLRDDGVTVFLNSHLLSEVELVCDRVAVIHRGSVVAMGRLEQLLGVAANVRIRATNVSAALLEQLRAFGSVREESGSYLVAGLTENQIPALVQTLVSGGARLYALEPLHQSLEERFLELLQQPEASRAHD
ncbi:MAG: ABC transporter ATP-binding protein [Chloroflexi bacterium]|nr:ABC transporter ATP-binding protein [Chloroflexota bacterium]